MKRLYVLLIAALFSSCSIKFTGASIPAEMKTVNVMFFENNASLVIPSMANSFTENLKERIRNQTSLNVTPNDPNGVFSGNITSYDVRPTTTQDNNNNRQNLVGGTNRMTLRVSVKYTNNLNPKLSFEESFERFVDFPTAGQNFQAQEAGLNLDVIKLVTEDIFNRAFANW